MFQRRTKAIDCDQCKAYECFQDQADEGEDQANEENMDEQVSEWIKKMSECEASGSQWNGIDLYYGAICSPYGDGVELAIFLDEDCSIYSSESSFSKVYNPYYNGEEINYLTYAENFIKSAFSDTMSCLEPEYEEPLQNGAVEEEEDLEGSAVNEYCQQIIGDNAMNFNECDAAEAEEAEEEAAQDEEFAWYEYDLTADDAENLEQVCSKIKEKDGEYFYAYDHQKSGTWYKRNKNGEIVNEAETQPWNTINEMTGLSAAAIGGIVAGVVVALMACICLCRRRKSSDTKAVYQGGSML